MSVSRSQGCSANTKPRRSGRAISAHIGSLFGRAEREAAAIGEARRDAVQTWPSGLLTGSLVFRRLLFHVIDDQDWYRALLHFQFQPQLLGHCVEEREGAIWIRC